jgi:acetolactate synthase-1/3 small subunit
MTIVCEASAEAGHRIRASLYKLENVAEVDDIGGAPSVTRELALIKVAATPRSRSHLFELAQVFRADIVDVASESLTIQLTGVESKIEGLIQVLNESEDRILEICRSGKMTMRRGHHTSSVLKAMGAGASEPQETLEPANPPAEDDEDSAANEPE